MFSDENSVHISHLTHALYIPHPLESLITLIIFGIQCKLWTSSLYSFLRFPAYSQILCSTPLSYTVNHIFHLMLVKNALIRHEYIFTAILLWLNCKARCLMWITGFNNSHNSPLTCKWWGMSMARFVPSYMNVPYESAKKQYTVTQYQY
jgi:hypothetical protein